MEIKTSNSYQKEVLEKYKRNKGGELSTYLIKPTPRLIKQACALLIDRRTSANDNHILNCFFQFENEANRLREVKNFDNDRFRPIVNFLKGKAQTTSSENIELISWLIDFKPRPLHKYLKLDSPIYKAKDKEQPNRLEPETIDEPNSEEEIKKKKRRKLLITISIAFGAILMTTPILKELVFTSSTPIIKPTECMAWADSLYVPISCDKSPLSDYGTQVKPINEIEFKNMRKVEVDAAYPFFSDSGKPKIWYYKKNSREIEYFTSPGLHPTNGETLRKITPHIIKTYVPNHIDRKGSFLH